LGALPLAKVQKLAKRWMKKYRKCYMMLIAVSILTLLLFGRRGRARISIFVGSPHTAGVAHPEKSSGRSYVRPAKLTLRFGRHAKRG
jgi:hypothetical protein